MPAFLDHNINGGTVFLLTEDHLRELGLTIVGDRLYFIDLLTRPSGSEAPPAPPPGLLIAHRAPRPRGASTGSGLLRSSRWSRSLGSASRLGLPHAEVAPPPCTHRQLYDDIVAWSAAIGVQLATHPVPPLRKLGVSLTPTSWTVKDVCKVLRAVGLEEYMELFVEHRVQGDVIFNLSEENLKEMGIAKVGDRLLITDITQTLYEQITGWQATQVQQQKVLQQQQAKLPQLAA